LKKTTKIAGLAAAATTALFGLGSLNSAANACGTAQGANVFPGPPSPVYTSGAPSPSGTQTGYVGVGGSTPGGSGYAQATGTAGAGGVDGNITLAGTSAAGGGSASVGNDGNQAGGPVPANEAGVGACAG
jgi:hypothetical protein